jgi:hypothetical protein
MKRLLFLSMCILLIGAAMVNAEIIKVDANRTVYDGTYDKVVLTITGFDGALLQGESALTTMLGTWTCTGGMDLLGTAGNWYTKTVNDYDGQDVAAPQSWVDFSTKSPDTATRTGVSGAYTSFYEGYANTPDSGNQFGLVPVDISVGGSDNAFDNTLLGVFYVKHADTSWVPGATIWTGIAAFGIQPQGGGGDVYPSSVVINGAPTPEPSTLALLGSGLFGLLAYAWRKRK